MESTEQPDSCNHAFIMFYIRQQTPALQPSLSILSFHSFAAEILSGQDRTLETCY